MRDTFPPLPVGQSLIAASLPGIGQIHGIIVDNPSGQWLYVSPVDDYVPPYTLGWARSYPGGTVTISVAAGQAPSGQVSTLQGDPVRITIDSEPVGTSQGAASGSAFIEDFTETLTSVTFTTLVAGGIGGLVVILPAIPGKRYRLFVFSVEYNATSNFPASPVSVSLRINAGTYIDTIMLNPERLGKQNIYSNGIDMPVGAAIQYSTINGWRDEQISILLAYQVI